MRGDYTLQLPRIGSAQRHNLEFTHMAKATDTTTIDAGFAVHFIETALKAIKAERWDLALQSLGNAVDEVKGIKKQAAATV